MCACVHVTDQGDVSLHLSSEGKEDEGGMEVKEQRLKQGSELLLHRKCGPDGCWAVKCTKTSTWMPRWHSEVTCKQLKVGRPIRAMRHDEKGPAVPFQWVRQLTSPQALADN